jgi:hypothetical protein
VINHISTFIASPSVSWYTPAVTTVSPGSNPLEISRSVGKI